MTLLIDFYMFNINDFVKNSTIGYIQKFKIFVKKAIF